MTESKFKIGDLVKLKSGGMTMTIHNDHKWDTIKGINDYSLVSCTWFDDKNKLNKHWFRVDVLVSVTN